MRNYLYIILSHLLGKKLIIQDVNFSHFPGIFLFYCSIYNFII